MKKFLLLFLTLIILFNLTSIHCFASSSTYKNAIANTAENNHILSKDKADIQEINSKTTTRPYVAPLKQQIVITETGESFVNKIADEHLLINVSIIDSNDKTITASEAMTEYRISRFILTDLAYHPFRIYTTPTPP